MQTLSKSFFYPSTFPRLALGIPLSAYFLFFIFYFLFPSCTSPFNIRSIETGRVLRLADQYLDEEPVTITHSFCDRSAGGVHDYYSEGDYWWPDSANPEGPYIRKDGQTNPDNFTAHRNAMRRMSQIVPALVAAYKITGDVKYADQAMKHLRAWFMDEQTRMNPNLLYAQAIKGRVTGRGIGIIDTIHLVEVARAIGVLEALGYGQPEACQDLRSWFASYLEWMTTHPYGLQERDNGNNHSTCWAMQVAEFSRLTGNDALMDSVRVFFKTKLLDQMATDGSFPKELSRTKPYGYSLFNLDAMAMVCQITSIETDNLWVFSREDGRSMQLALEFMYPYIVQKSDWPYPDDVMYHEYWPVRHPALLFGGIAYQNEQYLQTWKTLDPDPQVDEIVRNYPIRQPLLWIES